MLKRIWETEEAGHKLLFDGRSAFRDKGYYIGPTIFSDVPNGSDLAQNEVFGPVVSTESWDDEEDVFVLQTIAFLA